MALASQFSLSLELTRLIPLNTVVDKAAEAVIKIARELRNSGSDILAEEDMLRIFGYARIERRLESQFRQAMRKESGVLSKLPLCEGIVLDGGPGPTVVRALQNEEYSRLVIQCSFLTAVFEKSELASAIKTIFDKDLESAPPKVDPPSVSHASILGVLTACHEQTSAFPWTGYLDAVACLLGISVSTPVHPAILRGAARMFPLVQAMPEDRLMLIKNHCQDGVCVLSVWAHHILGLNVLVKLYHGREEECREEKLGSGSAQVIIDTKAKRSSDPEQPSILLLDASDQDVLFKLQADIDESLLAASHSRPARGYGKLDLERFFIPQGKHVAVEEMMQLAATFATLISRSIAIVSEDTSEVTAPAQKYSTLEGVLNSACFLFDTDTITEASVSERTQLYGSMPLNDTLEPPPSLTAVLEQYREARDFMWNNFLCTIRSLAVVVLAFSRATDLERFTDCPLSINSHIFLTRHPLMQSLQTWNGRSPIKVSGKYWFQAIGLLFLGPTPGIADFNSTALVSNHGWSMFVVTLSNRDLCDPIFTQEGQFTVQKGVPCRNGVRKRFIIDGPARVGVGTSGRWYLAGHSGATITAHCGHEFHFLTPLIGEDGDCFVISVRIVEAHPSIPPNSVSLSGYRGLFDALNGVQRTSDCSHFNMSDQALNTLTLEPRWASTTRIYSSCPRPPPEDLKLVILFTFENPAARWTALARLSHWLSSWDRAQPARRIILRSLGCCLNCAVEQVARRDGLWWLVL